MAISFAKFTITFRRYRLPIIILNFLVFYLFLNASKNRKTDDTDALYLQESESDNPTETIELRQLRLAFSKWRFCMIEQIDDRKLYMEDLDPDDNRFSYLSWLISEDTKRLTQKSEDGPEDIRDDRFETIWTQLDNYAKKCRQETDIWHMEPETVPNTLLNYFLPNPIKTPATFVRVGIGADVTIEKFFKSKLSDKSSFFGADPVYAENADIYASIGTFFPFAVGNETGRAEAILKFSKDRQAPKTVNHIGIDTLFTKLIRKKLVDYLVFEANGGEYEMMSHLAKYGTLEEAGITICQINVEYHRPKSLDDPKKNIFLQHILQFIRDKKYTLLNISNVGNLRAFWFNSGSKECVKRFAEHLFTMT